MQKWRVIGVAVAAMFVLSGCGTTVQGVVPAPSAAARTPTPKPPTPTPTPPENTVFHPGPPEISISTQEGEGNVTVRQYAWRRTANGPDAVPPKNSYLVLDVLVRATSGRVQVNPLYFTLRTADGSQLRPVMGADGNEPVLASRDLTDSAEVDGLVAFDSPRGEVTLLIADELGNQVGEITLADPPS